MNTSAPRTSKDLETTVKNFSLEVEFTQFVLEEPQGKAAFRMSGEGRRNIKKLVVTVGNRDYEAPTPARPAVVLPLRALPVDALLSMEYEGKFGMHKVTHYPITIRTAEKGSGTCAVM